MTRARLEAVVSELTRLVGEEQVDRIIVKADYAERK